MEADSAGLIETLFATIPVALMLLAPDCTLLRANAAFAALLGSAVTELAGRPLAEIAPRLSELLDTPLQRACTTGESGEDVVINGAEARIEPEGGVWQATIYPLLQAGRVAGLAVVLLDVSGQRRMELELRRSEERFRALVQNATDIVVVLNAAGQVQYASPSAQHVLGYDPDAVVGLNVFSLIHPEDVPRLQAIFAGVVGRSGPFTTIEFRVRHADGSWRYVETTATNALADPAVRGIVQNVRDVTERKRIEAERDEQLLAAQEARAAAEAANSAKDLFLSIVSHELRAPLTPILAYAHMLRTRSMREEQRVAALEQIERSARTQARLVEDLLDVARIASGKLTLDRQRVPLAEVANAALDTVRTDAEARQIVLSASIAADAGVVLGDAGRLQQVLWNLLSNAIKFTPAGGRVAVTLVRVDDSVCITVADSGAGIAPEFLPHIFERFQQAESSAAHEQRGLGLGLALVHELVELHGGTVNVASPGLGQGATFTVTLPLAAEGEPLPSV
jgi:PAS domain S-box-containing protein